MERGRFFAGFGISTSFHKVQFWIILTLENSKCFVLLWSNNEFHRSVGGWGFKDSSFSSWRLGKTPSLTNIFQVSWNHQLVMKFPEGTVYEDTPSIPKLVNERSRWQAVYETPGIHLVFGYVGKTFEKGEFVWSHNASCLRLVRQDL